MTYRVVVARTSFPDLDIERGIVEGAGAEFVATDADSPAELVEVGRGADVLLSQETPITRAVFEALDLRVVGRYGIGVDAVDVDAATEHGVRVVNVPSYCEDEVSTHALALLLACVRNVAAFDRAVKAGTWDWKLGRPIHRTRGQTLGLAGFGKIPRRVAAKAEGFEFERVAYDPYLDAEEMAAHGVEKVDFDGLLARSDAVSVHTPLTEETRGLFDAEAFARMRETAVLVNTSRGAVVDTGALYDALDAGEIAAAGLDVMPEEPPGESPLFDRDDVVLTPHAAWYSEESIVELRRTLAADVLRPMEGEEPENVVNREVLGRE